MILLFFLLYLIIGLNFLYPFIIRYFGFPPLPTMSEQLLIVAFFILVYLNSAISNKKPNIYYSYLRIYAYLFLSFLLIEIFSAFLNSNSFLLVIKSMISFSIIYLLFFLAIIEMDMNEKGQRKVIEFIYAMILVQIPVTIFQYLFMNYSSADYNSGTISSANAGGTGTIGILMLFLQAFLISQIMVKGFNIKRIVLILLTLVPIVVGGVRLGIVLSPITIILTVCGYYFLNPNKVSKKAYNGIITIIFTVITMFILIAVVIPTTKYSSYLDLNVLTNEKNFEEYNNSKLSQSRTLPYYILFKYTLNSDINYLVGNGNEEITQSKMANVGRAKLSNRNAYPDAILILASNGIIGLSLVIMIFATGIKILRNYVKIEVSEFMRIVSYSIIPITFLSIISLFYTNAWSEQICLCYWVILAVLLQRYITLHRIKNVIAA